MTSGVPIVPERESVLTSLFGTKKPLIGMVHVLPLPGSPRYRGESMRSITKRAVDDALACVTGGMNGLIIENAGDVPFLHPDEVGMETVAAMTAVTTAVRCAVDVPLGVNVLANAARQSVAVAKAAEAQFVRANQWVNAYVANEGIVQGRAGTILRYRSALKAEDIRVFADVHVKHGSHSIVADRSLAEQTRDVEFFDADVLIATGQRTSDPTPVEEVLGVKTAATLPVVVGSGLTLGNVDQLMQVADGAIVGSGVKEDGVWWNRVSVARVKEIVERVDAIRASLKEGAGHA